jgi:hypothetical protein
MERMNTSSRTQYLKVLMKSYPKATREEKGRILDEYCKNTEQNRKYVIRKINALLFRPPPAPKKRSRCYGAEIHGVLLWLWKLFDYPCGQRLTTLLRTEVDALVRKGHLQISGDTIKKLKTISSATIDRLLKADKGKWRYERSHYPKKTPLLYKAIPLKLTDWDTSQVGFIEMDLVFHCGASTEGDHLYTLSTTEISSGWWEGEALQGRGQLGVFEALKRIRDRSPFCWLGIDSDNDSAFINTHLLRYCQDQGLEFSRSRPSRKNDNAYIEQKNYTHVRRPLGYLRYDTPEELRIIQDLYRCELRLFKNFFQPVMKLKAKQRLDGRLRRTYEQAKTPYHRLMESDQLSEAQKQRLRTVYQKLDPVQIKKALDDKLDRLYTAYRDKKKSTITVNPYKKQVPNGSSRMRDFHQEDVESSRL